tara:strand:+ start:101 stop:592 length:492 start_codon:yes stop_codon:yes gene_type:complete
MNNNIKDIFLIILASVLVGVCRVFFLGDISFIKQAPKLISDDELVNMQLDAPKVVTISQSKQMFDDKSAVFIDARDSLLYDDGHILGAINIHFESNDDDQILSKLQGVEEDDFLIIYCSGGDCDLSEELGNHLFEYLGYTNILLYEGGFPEWKENGYEVNSRE